MIILEAFLDVLRDFLHHRSHGNRSGYRSYRSSHPHDVRPMTRREWRKRHKAKRWSWKKALDVLDD
jgi:hypothetical protein